MNEEVRSPNDGAVSDAWRGIAARLVLRFVAPVA
jgi:hypothetical protein